MTAEKTAKALREMADRIEACGVDMNGTPSVMTHDVADRETLRRIVTGLMDHPKVFVADGYQWIRSVNDSGIEVAAFYKAGLLSNETETKTVVQEKGPDLAGLLKGETP